MHYVPAAFNGLFHFYLNHVRELRSNNLHEEIHYRTSLHTSAMRDVLPLEMIQIYT